MRNEKWETKKQSAHSRLFIPDLNWYFALAATGNAYVSSSGSIAIERLFKCASVRIFLHTNSIGMELKEESARFVDDMRETFGTVKRLNRGAVVIFSVSGEKNCSTVNVDFH